METNTEITEEKNRLTDGKLSLPFAFAKRHGVLVEKTNDGCTSAIYREGSSYLSLAELYMKWEDKDLAVQYCDSTELVVSKFFIDPNKSFRYTQSFLPLLVVIGFLQIR